MSETPGALAYDPCAATTPVYRQSNVGHLRLWLAEAHWESPKVEGRWCVQPGDVVLNKHGPVRAALVSAAARRHPVDGNTLIVRGLPWATAVWLAVCLNRPEYEELLLIESGLLRRVNLGALESLRVPPVPEEMQALASALGELLDALLAAAESLAWAKAEAEEASAAPASKRDLREGTFISPTVLSNDGWLPAAVALRAELAVFAGDLGWVAVRDLAMAEARTRLSSVPEGARALRLGDVAEDLYVAAAEAQAADLDPGRTLARPLIGGEVLISTLGASFRVAYVDEAAPPDTFPTDAWARLRFRETPAAWALLLATGQVRWQTSRLAVGTVQQFVPPEALMSVHLPIPEREIRDRWQRAVERHHAQRRALDRRWAALVAGLERVFERVHAAGADRTSRRSEVSR